MKSSTSTGVCGWSSTDLKLLSVEAVEVLAHIFHQAVTCGLPDHILRARICVLAKVLAPETMGQSRPITVFSTLYRLWSSVMARQVLAEWAPTFPPAVAGSMPGVACRDVSYRLQHRVEVSLLGGPGLLGCSIDLIKAFNQLPWVPLASMLVWLGVPEEIVRFWIDCLRRHCRHTVFLGHLSDAIQCANGAPEGDPFSVVAMAAVCFWCHRLQESTGVIFETYVDNWSWTSTSSANITAAVPLALQFLQSLSLPIDGKKSYAWATHRAGRVWWKRALPQLFPGLPVQLVHAGLESIDRLRQQPRPVQEKAALLQRSVWPRCLYGAEGHLFTATEFQLLRGRAARALIGQHKVLSPLLALSAVTLSVMDPQPYCLLRQLCVLRRVSVADAQLADSVLSLACTETPPRCSQGPATALRLSLDRIGLSISLQGLLKGPDNQWVYIKSCRPSQLAHIVCTAWSYYVQRHTDHRNGLDRAAPCHPATTSSLFTKLQPAEQLIISRHIVGAFSSAAAKSKWGNDLDDRCPLCGAKQTKLHKFFHCPKLAHVRAEWRLCLEEVHNTWPHWVHGPFATLPPGTEVLHLIHQTRHLPPTAVYPEVQVLLQRRPFLRLFTDGSCVFPDCPDFRRAAFAVVLDASSMDEEIPQILQAWRTSGCLPPQLHVLTKGLVPGVQTINRAEICAVIMAARFARAIPNSSAAIHTDSEVAMAAWDCVARGRPGPWPDLDAYLQEVFDTSISLYKVKAHTDLHCLCGMPQWFAVGNQVVDAAAKLALTKELDLVQQLSADGQQSLREQRDLLWLFWRYLLQLSREEVRLLELCKGQLPLVLPDEAPCAAPSLTGWLTLDPGPFSSWGLPCPDRAWLLAASWPPWFTLPLWSWLRDCCWSQYVYKSRTPHGTSYIELMLDFVLTSGICPPVSLEAAGRMAEAPQEVTAPVAIRQMIKCFVEAVRQLERLSKRKVWPVRRKKVFALRALGFEEPRIGVEARLRLLRPVELGQLMVRTLHEGSAQAILDFVRGSGQRPHPDVSLQNTWQRQTPSDRAKLGRMLKR
ncbi:hypothetical protein AK812_SmicGene15941 [Symbiodinium microadriaticum]|uniref:Uncharacterized protein n=1 Tax=Symbiodinium microadriaticum TaxID=2951 RepID=A0A1Q9E1L4_SYMMI|nr:hypothetical protein AK812_SmicGene15941 [Symbiodinium microadriaticum]CAE7513200.1 unnamed protein product [Symbiodinium microadriaticum]